MRPLNSQTRNAISVLDLAHRRRQSFLRLRGALSPVRMVASTNTGAWRWILPAFSQTRRMALACNCLRPLFGDEPITARPGISATLPLLARFKGFFFDIAQRSPDHGGSTRPLAF